MCAWMVDEWKWMVVNRVGVSRLLCAEGASRLCVCTSSLIFSKIRKMQSFVGNYFLVYCLLQKRL